MTKQESWAQARETGRKKAPTVVPQDWQLVADGTARAVHAEGSSVAAGGAAVCTD